MVAGKRICNCVCSISLVASPSAAPGARLNDIVTAGNCPWWATASDVLVGPKCANADKGTCAPVEAGVAVTGGVDVVADVAVVAEPLLAGSTLPGAAEPLAVAGILVGNCAPG